MYEFVSLEELELQAKVKRQKRGEREKGNIPTDVSLLKRTHNMCCRIKGPFGNINHLGICVSVVTAIKY